ADHMSQPGHRVATPDIEHPLPEYGRIDQRQPPECLCYVGMAVEEFLEFGMSDEPHGAIGKSGDAAIQRRKVKALQIRQVTRNVDRHVLASTGVGLLVAGCEAGEHGEGVLWPIPFTDDIFSLGEFRDPDVQYCKGR